MATNGVYLHDLDQLERVTDAGILFVEDEGKTGVISVYALRKNLVDDVSASFDKTYSSAKVNYLIEEERGKTNEEVRRINEQIELVRVGTASAELVNSIFEDIRSSMLTKTDGENIQSALNGVRKKTELIGASDLDTSSDERKIHLRHLAEEVKMAMAGETPIALVKSPVGGWTTESIANLAITSKKLAANYRFRSFITSGSLDEVLQDGVYLVSPGVDRVPMGYVGDTEIKLLTVTVYGENRDYIKQELEYINTAEYRPTYIRKGKMHSIHTVEFQAIYPINGQFKIDVSLMGDELTNRGLFEGENVFELTAEGTYKVGRGVANLPTDTDEYFVSVHRYGDCIVYEALLNSDSVGIMYLAYSHTNSYGISITTPWYKITNNNRSKFDDRNLHIFGDGIAYGLGVNDTSNMYPQLMRQQYGFKVLNHAIDGATMGSYGSSVKDELSVITQIANTHFSDDDIAIIFAGAEDFRSGTCPIGNDTDNKDTTFKGSLNKALAKLYEANPSVRVLLLTPMYRGSLDPKDGRDSDYMTVAGRKLADYAQAVIDISKAAHIPYIDLMNTLGVNKYTAGYYLSDNGIYLNDKGQELLSIRLFNVLSSLF